MAYFLTVVMGGKNMFFILYDQIFSVFFLRICIFNNPTEHAQKGKRAKNIKEEYK
jgi:hypothetical protein